jgi:FKBP-type peptidyl-prolyl cis-trans isomerase FklB
MIHSKLLIMALVFFPLLSCTSGSKSTPQLSTDRSKVSYALGHQLGTDYARRTIDVDVETMIQGLRDGIAEKKSPLSEEETQRLFEELQKSIRERSEKATETQAQSNLEAGEKFLDESSKKEGSKKTASGLIYRVLNQGKGPTPTINDTVVTHYRGTLIDGTEFDSSYSRNQPASFPVAGVIKGWTEALQLMNVGSKFELIVPPQLAYGRQGAGPKIGPNATLIFTIELLGIQGSANSQETTKPTSKPNK